MVKGDAESGTVKPEEGTKGSVLFVGLGVSFDGAGGEILPGGEGRRPDPSKVLIFFFFTSPSMLLLMLE